MKYEITPERLEVMNKFRYMAFHAKEQMKLHIEQNEYISLPNHAQIQNKRDIK